MSSVGMTIFSRGSVVRVGLLTLLLAVVSTGARAAGPDELLGWRCGPAAWSFKNFTFFEAVDKTAALGLHSIEAFEGQRVSKDIDAKIAADLSDPLIARVRAKLDAAGVKLTSLYIHTLPGDEALARKAFTLGHKLGIETIVSEPAPESLNVIERLCDEYKINVAIHDHPKGQSRYWHPQEVLKVVEGRSPRLGACADIGHWQRSGIRPVDGLKLLGSRLITLHVKDLDKPGPDGHDVPWGTGKGEIAEVLRTVQQLGIKPTLFTIEYEYNWDNNAPEVGRCAEFFRQTVAAMAAGEAARERPLSVGWATVDITPPKPVALVGQLVKRISTGVRDPITATVLALETRGEGEKGDREQAVMVSCDVISIPREIQRRLQEKVASRLPDLDARKIFLNATHTHTAPGFLDSQFKGLYDVSHDPGVMKASEYADLFIDRVAQAVVKAWEGKKPGGLSWALSRAVISFNRRAHYFDGTTKMYGETATPAFANVEGSEDHAVDLLFLWRADGNLTGVVINLACPSQETEQLHEISADFWHDARAELHRRLGPGLFILPQCAPAGDLSPHLIYRKQAEQVMDSRRGLSRRKDIARRITDAVVDVLPLARADIKTRLVFRHTVASANLIEHPQRGEPFYETDPVRPIEFHVLRLGDVAMATNPFELFVDYATRIEARSRAVSTMLVQLSSGSSGYLPTERAVKGGGYSADKFIVGPAGGQVLVEETLKRINELWP